MTVHKRAVREGDACLDPHYVHFGSEQHSHLKAVKRDLLRDGFHKIVIQGQAGSGKTFLVNAILQDANVQRTYDRVLSATVADSAHNLSAVYAAIWQQLNQGLAPANTETRLNGLLRKELVDRRVLLVVDGVRAVKQAEQLCSILGCNSGIIITTTADVEFHNWTTYCTHQLSAETSGRILLAYAFPGVTNDLLLPKLKKIGINTVNEIIKNCNGVPLIVKVTGLTLKSASQWITAAQLLDAVPAHAEQPLLHVWYELLGDDLIKQCVLDLVVAPACYEWSKSSLQQFLQHSRNISALEASSCADKLIGKNAVEEVRTSSGHVRFRFPRLLRSFAESLVEMKSGCPTETERLCQPGTCHTGGTFPAHWQVAMKTHFWNHLNHHSDVVYQATAISMMDSDISGWVPPSHTRFPKLRVMMFSNCVNLRKLKLRGAEASLCSLDLGNCTSLETLPDKLSHCTQLQYLNLKNCEQLTEMPSFSKCTKLRVLNLEGCRSLKALPKGLEHVTSLLVLNLKGCASLSKLPSGVGYGALTSLPLDSCSGLHSLPDSIGRLTTLQTITAPGCASLTALPDTMRTLVYIKEMDFSSCTGLKTLGPGLGEMFALEKLNLDGCVKLASLPDNVGHLHSLKELHMRSCSNLCSIPESLSNLTQLSVLSLTGCRSLSYLPSGIGELTQLMELDLSESRLHQLPDSVGNLRALTHLNLNNCRIIKHLPESIALMESLEVLKLSGCTSLLSLPENIHHLASLKHLFLSGCSQLHHLPPSLPNLPVLQSLSLSCTALVELPQDISSLTALTLLSLRNCSCLRYLPPSFGNLASLSALDLKGCTHIRCLPANFCSLSSLETLFLDDLPNLFELPSDIGSLFSLVDLSLSHCTSLEKLPPGIANLTTLQVLSLSSCSGLLDLPTGITRLKCLRELDLAGCSNLTSLPKNMHRMTALTAVYLWACAALSSAQDVGLSPSVVKDTDLHTDNVHGSEHCIYRSRSGRELHAVGLSPRASSEDTASSTCGFSTTLEDVAEEDEEDLIDA